MNGYNPIEWRGSGVYAEDYCLSFVCTSCEFENVDVEFSTDYDSVELECTKCGATNDIDLEAEFEPDWELMYGDD